MTLHKQTDFGDVWYVNSTDGSFRFAIYRYDDDSDTIYLSNVFVSEENRGQGYGNTILNIVDDIAKGMGATTICLTVKKGSFAHQWYERHGYEDFCDNEDEGYVGHIWMKKQL
jgi:predicted GNAT family acetyltransferase